MLELTEKVRKTPNDWDGGDDKTMRCWQFAMLNDVVARNGWTKFVGIQDEYSLLYREVCP
jgi:hypothetical protein